MVNIEHAIKMRDMIDELGFEEVMGATGLKPETLVRYVFLAKAHDSAKATHEAREKVLSQVAPSTSSTWADGPKVLVIDIETLPAEAYIWGPGKQYVGHKQIIKGKDWCILSFAAKWIAGDEIFGDKLSGEAAVCRDDALLCEQLWPLMNEADIIIAHNGDKFDVRKINARMIANGIMAPPAPYETIDTLIESRKVFAHSSHSQDYLTKLFKIPEKLKTEYQMWIDCATGDEDAIDRMFEYNKGDIAGLEEMYFKLRPWMRKHPNFGLYYDEDNVSRCPKCGSKKIMYGAHYYYTPLGRFKSFRCNDCGSLGRSRKSDLSKEEREVLVATVAR